MRKNYPFVIYLFCLWALLPTDHGYGQESNPFKKFFSGSKEPKNETVIAAEKMHLRFSNKNPGPDFNMPTQTRLRNPFLSQIPEDAVPPVQTEKITDPVPILNTNADQPIAIEPPPNFTVAGMVWDTKVPMAIIEQSVLKTGDRIKGWKILDISQDGVMIESEKQSRYLIKPKEVLHANP